MIVSTCANTEPQQLDSTAIQQTPALFSTRPDRARVRHVRSTMVRESNSARTDIVQAPGSMVTDVPAVDEGPPIVETHDFSTNSRPMGISPITLNDLAVEMQTTDPHVLLQHLLVLYNNLVGEYHQHVPGPPAINEHANDRGEAIGLGVEGLSSPSSSFSGRLRNLRRRSMKSLRGEWHKNAHALSPSQELSSEVPQIPEFLTRPNHATNSELPRALSPVSNSSPRLWRKPSGSRNTSTRVPDSPSQRNTPQSINRMHASASPNLSSRSLSSGGSRRPNNSRPSTPVSRAADDMVSLTIFDHSHLTNAEITTYCSSVRTQGGVDVLTFRVRLVVNALLGDSSDRGRNVIRVEKSYLDIVSMHERILVRAMNLAPGTAVPSLPLPDRSLFELPCTPWSLMDRDHAVDTFLHAIQRLPGRFDDLLIQFFTTDQVQEPPVDPIYGACLHQECLLRASGDAWMIVRCSLHTNTLIISDPQSIGAPLIFDLRRTRIGRQMDHGVPMHDQGTRFATIILQSIVPTSSATNFVKLTTESLIQYNEWMSALLRESGEHPHDKISHEPCYDPDVRLGPVSTEAPATPNRDVESQDMTSGLSPRSDKPNLAPQSPSKADITRHVPGMKARMRQNAENVLTSPNMGEWRRYLFGILPMGSSDDAQPKSVFGAPLAETVHETGIPSTSSGGLIPGVVYRCIEFLEGTNAMQEEGLYRVSGSASGMKQLQERFNTNGDVDLLAEINTTSKQRLGSWHDSHAVAGLLKLYLRILPENICTETLLPQFSKSVEIQDREERCTVIYSLMEQLPPENFALLEALISHLNRVQQLSSKNKMTPQNLGIVFSATLNMPVDLVVTLVSDHDLIFRRKSVVPTALAVESVLETPAPPIVDAL